jgi:hypothetical protein
MVRHFYAWTPLVILGTFVILTLPWLGGMALIVFALVALVALGALLWVIVWGPYMLVRWIARRWRHRHSAAPRTAVLSPANHQDA